MNEILALIAVIASILLLGYFQCREIACYYFNRIGKWSRKIGAKEPQEFYKYRVLEIGSYPEPRDKYEVWCFHGKEISPTRTTKWMCAVVCSTPLFSFKSFGYNIGALNEARAKFVEEIMLDRGWISEIGLLETSIHIEQAPQFVEVNGVQILLSNNYWTKEDAFSFAQARISNRKYTKKKQEKIRQEIDWDRLFLEFGSSLLQGVKRLYRQSEILVIASAGTIAVLLIKGLIMFIQRAFPMWFG